MSKSMQLHLGEIQEFLSSYKPSSFDGASVPASFASAYKRFHAVLIWQDALDRSATVSAPIKIYMNEATADLSHSLLCSIFSFYKPSRMMLRSTIENLMRVCVLLCGSDPFQAKSTYELVSLFTGTKLSKAPETNRPLQLVLRTYDEMCKYVHTSTPMHMDMRIPFASITARDENDLLRCLVDIDHISGAINMMLFTLTPDILRGLHHRDADHILDCVPPSLKRLVNGL